MSKYSLGEIDALARKATRGAAYSWGMAEEVGKAVRWLSAYGFLGVEMLAQHLQVTADQSQNFTPCLMNEKTDALLFHNAKNLDKQESKLCALSCGSLMNDLGYQIRDDKLLSFNNVFFPLLVLPAAGRIAEAYNITVSFKLEDNIDTIIYCDPDGISIKDTPPLLGAFNVNDSCNILCKKEHSAVKNTHFPYPNNREIKKEALEILEIFAHKTYAPDTEESRMRGAGES